MNEEIELLEQYRMAIRAVRKEGKAGASILQRKLRIGYAHSARLLDMMEEDGIIGASNGAKPREVFLAPAVAVSETNEHAQSN